MEDNDKPISERLKKFLKDNIAVLPFLEGKIDNLTEEELEDLFSCAQGPYNPYFGFGKWGTSNKYSAKCGFHHDIWETKEYDTYSEGLEEAIIEFVNSFNYIDETGDYLYILRQ